MPQRTIYLSKSDEPVFAAAQKAAESKGTSVSRVIMDGLEKFVEENSKESSDGRESR